MGDPRVAHFLVACCVSRGRGERHHSPSRVAEMSIRRPLGTVSEKELATTVVAVQREAPRPLRAGPRQQSSNQPNAALTLANCRKTCCRSKVRS